MLFFLAEINKKIFLFSASDMIAAVDFSTTNFKGKTVKVTKTEVNLDTKFKLGTGTVCTVTKVKGTSISFITPSLMAGKIDISMLPVELA